jgi:hypothetical protein
METIFSSDDVLKCLVAAMYCTFGLFLLLLMVYKMGKAEKLREPETV